MGQKLVVIEDDPASLDLMMYLLGAHGYTALGASRGDDGIGLVRRERPDLVICDIQLPGLDGYAIARLLKADTSLCATRCVAVTAMAMVGDREKVMAAGFDAYLTKPIDPQVFIEQIAPLLGPLRAAALPMPVAAERPRHENSSHRGTIAVIDDNATNLDLKRSIFEPLGYRVLTASTSVTGFQLVLKELPDVIITDIGLPDESGLGLLRRLKGEPRLRHIPVVIITSTHRESAIRDESLSLGAARFLVRPLDAPRVLSEIETILKAGAGRGRGVDSGR